MKNKLNIRFFKVFIKKNLSSLQYEKKIIKKKQQKQMYIFCCWYCFVIFTFFILHWKSSLLWSLKPLYDKISFSCLFLSSHWPHIKFPKQENYQNSNKNKTIGISNFILTQEYLILHLSAFNIFPCCVDELSKEMGGGGWTERN